MPASPGTALPAAPPTATTLYPALVGPDWDALPTAVRRLHAPTPDGPARGIVAVRRGASLVARLLGAVFGLPPAGEAQPAELSVTTVGERQRWSRRFGGAPLVTDQAAHDGALLEFMGPFALSFRLRVGGGALVFEQGPTRLGRPGFLLPWPALLSPRVDGRCEADGADRARVRIEVRAPIGGMLVAYEGVFVPAAGT